MLATEEGRKLIAEASQKMLKLITMIPKVFEVSQSQPENVRASGQRSLQALSPQQRTDERLAALCTSMGLNMPTLSSSCTGIWSELFCGLASQIDHAIILVDMSVPGLPISFANNAFAELSGWRVEEVVGRNCRFLQGQQTEPVALANLINAVRNGTAANLQITNVKKSGVPFQNWLTLHPVHDSNGVYRYNIGVLSETKKVEGGIRMATKLPSAFAPGYGVGSQQGFGAHPGALNPGVSALLASTPADYAMTTKPHDRLQHA
jgi:PAS domain-containing protein